MTSGAMLGLIGGCLLGAGATADDGPRRPQPRAPAPPTPPSHPHHQRGVPPCSLSTSPPMGARPPGWPSGTTWPWSSPVSRWVPWPAGRTRQSVPATWTSTARVLVNPAVGQPVRPHAGLGAPGPAHQPGDRGPGRPVGGGAARRRPTEHGPDDRPAGAPGAGQRARQHADPGDLLHGERPGGRPAGRERGRDAYLDNRARRFDDVNEARIERVESQTLDVVERPPRGDRRRPGRQPGQALLQGRARGCAAQRAGQPARAAHRAGEQRGPTGTVISPAPPPPTPGRSPSC